MPSDLNVKLIGTKKYRCFIRKRKIGKTSTRTRFIRLKKENEEISKELESIEEKQRQVGEKMEAIEEECEQISKETKEIIRQTAITQIRLALMFNILKARQDDDIAKASHLTQLLREMIVKGIN